MLVELSYMELCRDYFITQFKYCKAILKVLPVFICAAPVPW